MVAPLADRLDTMAAGGMQAHADVGPARHAGLLRQPLAPCRCDAAGMISGLPLSATKDHLALLHLAGVQAVTYGIWDII